MFIDVSSKSPYVKSSNSKGAAASHDWTPPSTIQQWILLLVVSVIVSAGLLIGADIFSAFSSEESQIILNWETLRPNATIGTSAALGAFGVLATVTVALVFTRQDSTLTADQALKRIEQKNQLINVSMAIGLLASSISLIYAWGQLASFQSSTSGNPSLWEVATVMAAGQAIAIASVFSETSRGDQVLLAKVRLPRLKTRHQLISDKWQARWKQDAKAGVSGRFLFLATAVELVYLSIGFTVLWLVCFSVYLSVPLATDLATSMSLLMFPLILSAALFFASSASWTSKTGERTIVLISLICVLAPLVGAVALSFSLKAAVPIWWVTAFVLISLLLPFLPWNIPPRYAKAHTLVLALLSPGYALRQKVQLGQYSRRLREITAKRELASELRILRSEWPARQPPRPPGWTRSRR